MQVSSFQRKCAVSPFLHVYEGFDDFQGQSHNITRYTTPCLRSSPQANRHIEATVRHAHTHSISEFVSNFNEVYAHFASHDYPTFASVLRGKVHDVNVSRLFDAQVLRGRGNPGGS